MGKAPKPPPVRSAARNPASIVIVADSVVSLGKAAIWGMVAVLVAGYIRDAFVAFAGHETDARLSFSLVTKLGADRWFAFLFGGGGVAYGLHQGHMKRRAIRRLSGRAADLERAMDRKRSSSNLLPDGSTRPEDK
jgi:hypothetical protein